MKSAATPTSIPAASAPAAGTVPPRVRRTRVSPSRDAATASTSRCPPAISDQSTSGFTDHSRCARTRRAGSARSSRSRPSTTPANAIAFHSFSQPMIDVTDVPPRLAAAHCSAVPSGPYSDGSLRQVRGASLPIGSPVCCS